MTPEERCVKPWCKKCEASAASSTMLLFMEQKIDGTGHVECMTCGSFYEYTIEDGCLVYFEKVTANRLVLKGKHERG